MEPRYSGDGWDLWVGNSEDVLSSGAIPARSVASVVTSPPYFALRDYTDDPREIGDPNENLLTYVDRVAGVLNACRDLLARDGLLWLNLGDTYNAYNANRGQGGAASARRDESRAIQGQGLTDPAYRNKTALMVPQRVVTRLIDDGWVLRADITWKRHTLPERVRDRPRRVSERLFMLAPNDRYAARAPEHRDDLSTDIWELPSARGSSDHPARFATELVDACLAWTPASHVGGVLDPFSGSGTTGAVAVERGRHYFGVDLSAEHTAEAADRLALCANQKPLFGLDELEGLAAA